MKTLLKVVMLGLAAIACLPAAAEDAIKKTVTVTVQGEGLASTRWLAYRKAQHDLAIELPAVTRLEMTQYDGQIDAQVHKVLAQFVDSKLVDTKHKTIIQAPSKSGKLDDQGNSDNTIYEVTSTYEFSILPAAQVARAKQLLENEKLRKELSFLRVTRAMSPEFYIQAKNQNIEIQLVKDLSSKNAIVAAQKSLDLDMDEAILGMELNAEQYLQATKSGDRLFNDLAKINVEQKMVLMRSAKHERALKHFIDHLPIAYANTIKVTKAEHHFEKLNHSFGNDFFLPASYLKYKLGESGNPAIKKPMERIELTFDSTCKIKSKLDRNPETMTLCDLWSILPESQRNFIRLYGLAAGDVDYTGSNVPLDLIQGTHGPAARSVLAMPVTDSKYKTPASRGGIDSAYSTYSYGDNGDKKTKVPLESVSQFANARVVPEFFAAGFWNKPKVMLTIAFPETKQYVDIQLTSDRYLLRPKKISLYLNPGKTDEWGIKRRAASIKAFTWVKVKDFQLNPVHIKDGYRELQGLTHFANLAKDASDERRHSQMKLIENIHSYLANPLIESKVERDPSVEQSAVTLSACRQSGNQTLYDYCSNHLIVYHGVEIDINNRGIEHIIETPFNNPMLPMKECYTRTSAPSQNLKNKTCEEHFGTPEKLFTATTGFAKKVYKPGFATKAINPNNNTWVNPDDGRKANQLHQIGLNFIRLTRDGGESVW